ncbi:hypothetical protein CWIS_13525 [Cellulomonas sp. A375-1]|uniref:hypothetical protein n=1 Tax=Cellulomonas sp. A375-1 TaxID=1672219 RepID=UPI0006526531|nr:hypothetical protein [Cellulomonas sp. A375-1]KMM44849.1 hypothetical protein CWIS_13525 [Cellulomonas sp. A375-1]
MTTTTDERTALSDRAVATLRTAVPTLWGLIVTTLLGTLAGRLPDELYAIVERVLGSDGLLLLVVTLVVTAWYWLWRRVEDHIPLWLVRLALGSARTPSYAPVTVSGAAVITSVDAPAGYETAEVSDAKTEVADLLGQDFGGCDEPPTLGTLAAADRIIERLIETGWRPTG